MFTHLQQSPLLAIPWDIHSAAGEPHPCRTDLKCRVPIGDYSGRSARSGHACTGSTVLQVLALALLSAIHARAEVYTVITGEEGRIDYDLVGDQGNGWYSEPASKYRFKLGFKQGDRKSSNPVQVATVTPTMAEHFRGKSSIALQIIARDQINSPMAAYKVAIGSVTVKDPFALNVNVPKKLFHGFAMKIDPSNYLLPKGTDSKPLIFAQWWQGSPFHPPISLVIVEESQAKDHGWQDAGPQGNYALVLRDDDHNAYEKSPGKAIIHNLGPVRTGVWIQWVVGVLPDPNGTNGNVDVWMDGNEIFSLKNAKVGYDRKRYTDNEKPINTMGVDCCVYRRSGMSSQLFYFDEIRFADTYADAVAP